MLGWWGFLSKRQRKSAISKHCQSTYHDTLSEKYVNKIFLLFSGSESAEVSPNQMFESHELSVEMSPAEDFF